MTESARSPIEAFPLRKLSIISGQLPDANLRRGDEKKEVSKDIRYRTYYQDDSGEFIKAEDYFEPINLQPDSDDEEDDSVNPVLDIITYVTVRTLVATNHVNTEKAAKAAGESSEEKEKGESATTNDGEKSSGVTGLKIQSIGSTEMAIRSPSVQKALRSIIKYYPDQALAGKKITVQEPYYVLIHYQKELEKIAADLKSGTAMTNGTADLQGDEASKPYDANASRDIQVLLAFLNAKMRKKIEAEEQRYRQNPPRATFEMMWMLMRPGTQVYSERAGELDGFIVKSFKPFKPAGVTIAYKLVMWSLDFNGQYICRVRKERYIKAFDGEKDITTLQAFPTHLNIDGKKVPLSPDTWSKLVKRGDKYWEYLKKGCVQVTYDGKLLGTPQYRYKGKAVIDPESFYMQKNPKKIKPSSTDADREDDEVCQCEECKTNRESKTSKEPWSDFKEIDPRPKAKNREDGCEAPCEPRKLTPDHFFLFPREVPGFVLKTREWEILDINCLELCEASPEAIENLRIPEGRKKMIQMLSHKYTGLQREEDSWSADFVQSKGEGQIFLLHGPSGVGKTYTAECIAEMTGRPLLSLSVADIGTDEKLMEGQLKKWFDFAERWEAIMLIDEADVYFERRASGQLQRNSLVSSFLRSMEYYRGILFLTTNRLGSIDDAILSRIHLVLEYKDLDQPDRAKIWQQFFKKLTNERENFEVSEYAGEFVENDHRILDLKWNGREIRNAFQTAVALAEYEAKVSGDAKKKKVIVKKEHFVEVAEMSQAFKGYMERSFGDAAKRAWLEGVRMDDSIREISKARKEKFERDRQAKLAAK